MNDFDAQEAILQDRRKRYAQQLAGAQSPQGQMVGNTFVAPHALEYLAAGLRGYGGMKGEQMATQELGQLQGQRAEAKSSAMANFLRNAQGTDAISLPDDQQGPVQPAQAPNMGGAYAALMQSPDAADQSMGRQGVISTQQAQAAAQQKAAEQKRIQAMLSTMTPQEALANGVPADLVKAYAEAPNLGRSKVQFKDVGGSLVPVDDYGQTPQGVAPLGKTGDPFKDLLVTGPDGKPMTNDALVGAKSRVAAAGKPQINVDARNYNTQESKQSEKYGSTLGEIRGAITHAGFDAPRKLQQLERMETLLGGMNEGGKADPTLAQISSYANSVGIKLDPKLGAKEAAQALAVEMALGMKKPGSGPSTDKDFDAFMQTVPDLSKTPEGRRQITKTIRASVQRDLEASKFARDYAKKNGGVIDDNFFDALADFYAKNPVVTPAMPETNSRGNRLFDDADAILNKGKK